MDGENVIGYIDSLTSFGIIAPVKRSLIVTNKRLLIFNTKSVSTTATSAGFAYVFGVFGRGMANRITKDELEKTAKQYASGNLDDMLKSDSDNIGLDIASVVRVEIDRKNIAIITGDKKLNYALGNPDAKNKKSDIYDAYVQVLRQALGDKVVSK